MNSDWTTDANTKAGDACWYLEQEYLSKYSQSPQEEDFGFNICSDRSVQTLRNLMNTQDYLGISKKLFRVCGASSLESKWDWWNGK